VYLASDFISCLYEFHDKSTVASGSQEYRHYMLWQGICFLWGPSGSIVTGIAPNAHSLDEVERQAATIIQSQIQNAKRTLNGYLS
jgi:hypothetical protein